MANATVNLSLAKSGYVKEANPFTVYRTNTSTEYLISEDNGGIDNFLYFGFAAIPNNLRHNVLIGMSITFAARCEPNSLGPWIYIESCYDFDPATLTYNNKPSRYSLGFDESVTGTADNTLRNITASESGSGVAYFFKSGRCVSIRAYDRSSDASNDEIFAKTVLANGSTQPYATITYDNATKIKSEISVTSRPAGTVNPTQALTWVWDLVKDTDAVSGYCADETWAQDSGTFYYRIQGQSAWQSVSLGSSKSLTFPAFTFTAGVTYEYYIQVTDEDGTTSSYGTASSPVTFNTTRPTLTVYNLPAGSNYDTRPARTISWTLKVGSTEYEQASTTFFWRKVGASTWNRITASGNAKSLTIPANTFPTGATIERYVSSTDVNGNVYTLNTATFSTPTTKITATVYPSGRDVESGGPLIFSWVFRNSLGDYDQSSATLYWRSSTSDPWTAIQASGSEQSITVPKNTFPGNAATVYWYLEGTDIGGTTSTTSEQNFRTVTSQITPQNSPTSGYADPREPITFSWYFATPAGSYDQASATFYWRLQGSEAWTEVQAAGSTANVTIPANTFPIASTVEWYVSGTDAGGCSSTSTVYSFSTAASASYAIPVSPVGRVEDGTKAITYTWIVQNNDGSTATRTILSWKLPTESQSEWHTLLDTTDPVTAYTVPADTYAAGPVEWRVVAYNRDDVAGPAGEASFVVLRAPEAPEGLTATAVPRTTVRWQSTGQEGYEVTIDGEVVASAYGPATYSYQQIIPLEDGPHQIRVRIQGAYGLWSNYAETSILVANTPDGTLTLVGAFGVDALLQVSETIDPDTEIHWYRDGVRIGRTVGSDRFTDRFALGTHDYYAEIWGADGNYTRSNIVTGTMSTGSPMIAAASGGAWLSLRLSTSSRGEQTFNWSRESALTHVSGAAYPVLDLAPYEDLSGSYDCAFRDPAEAKAFEALRGKVVVLKSRNGHVLVGGLTELRQRVNIFYTSYTFSLQQIDWEDFVDDAQND